MILNSKHINGRAKDLEEHLNSVIIGQADAIKELCAATQRYFAGLANPKRPISILYFSGKTGCGKTLVAEELAKFLEVKKFMKINCGEFQQSHEVAKLMGSPPGYLGHNETKAFFNKKDIEGNIPNVILFDEIEKASDSLFHILLSILDKGELKLGNNDVVSFNNCIIIFTSNISVDGVRSATDRIGFIKNIVSIKDEKKILRDVMKKKYRPEFCNRIDEVIQFRTLDIENMSSILELQLTDLQNRLMGSTLIHKKVFFVIEDAAKTHLITKGYSAEYGARYLNRVLTKEIELPLSCVLGDPRLESGDVVRISLSKATGQLIFNRERINKKKTKSVSIAV